MPDAGMTVSHGVSPAVPGFMARICLDMSVGACALWVIKYFAVTPA